MFRFVRPLAITAVMIAAVTSAQAHTSENVLFVCSGTLEGDHGYTINDKLDELTYPMSCDIDEKVCQASFESLSRRQVMHRQREG